MPKLTSLFLLPAVALALVACGGGGGEAAQPASPLDAVPPQATQSVAGWVGYLDRLTKAQDADTREGVEVSAAGIVGVPGDDASEPTIVSL